MNSFRIGEWVWVKFDVEQQAKIEDINGNDLFCRVFDGHYIDDSEKGEIVRFRKDEVWKNE